MSSSINRKLSACLKASFSKNTLSNVIGLFVITTIKNPQPANYFPDLQWKYITDQNDREIWTVEAKETQIPIIAEEDWVRYIGQQAV